MKELIVGLILLFSTNVYAKTYNLDTVTVQASRSNAIVREMNKDIILITAEDISKTTAKTVPELLSTKAGIYSVYDGNIKNAFVGMHASGETSSSNMLVLVDGRRTNQIDLSGVDWAQINLDSIDHIEIIKGSGTVLHGDNANAGIINIITKQGQKNTKPKVALSTQWGSYQSNKHGLELTGGLSKIGYQFNYTHDETTGYRANSDYWANDFNSRINIDPTDDFGIDFSQGYHLDRYQSPGATFLQDIARYGHRGVRPRRNDDRGWTSDAYFTLMPRLKFELGESEGELSMLGTSRKRNSKSYSTGSTVTDPLYETMYLTNSYQFQPKLILSTPLTDLLGNKVTGGFDEFYAKSQRRSGNLGSAQDLTFISKTTHEVYLLDELMLDEKWLVNIGARRTWAQYVFDQKAQVIAKSKRSSTTESFEGGIGYNYNPESRIYTSFSRSYRLPNTDEFYQNIYTAFGGGGGLNTNLTYQVGNHYEWGIKHGSIKNTQLGLNFFVDQYKDEIHLDYINFNLVNTNYGARTRHYGVDADFAVVLLEGKVEPYVNLTLQDANFVGGKYNHKKMPLVPDQMANAGVILRPMDRLSTTFSVQEIGKRFSIGDTYNQHAKLKQNITANWGIKYDFKNMEMWFNIDNVLDKEYYAYGTYSPFSSDIGYYAAPGRQFTAGMKLEF